jgi:hypothetical protein
MPITKGILNVILRVNMLSPFNVEAMGHCLAIGNPQCWIFNNSIFRMINYLINI